MLFTCLHLRVIKCQVSASGRYCHLVYMFTSSCDLVSGERFRTLLSSGLYVYTFL